jgi:hypothetical protein
MQGRVHPQAERHEAPRREAQHADPLAVEAIADWIEEKTGMTWSCW